MTINTTLSKRGIELKNGFNPKDKFKMIFDDPFDAIKNPSGFVNIGTAENYAMLPEATEFANRTFECPKLQMSYGEGPWGSLRLRTAMAKHMTKYFNAIEPVDPENIIFANGVTSLCEMLGFTIGDPGDGVLFSRPIYQAFRIDFGTKAKVQSVYADFGDVDQFSLAAVEKYEAALLEAENKGIHVRALMLCNPHNPLGQCYPKDTIVALMKLCDKYKIHLLCDEIYANSVYEVPDKKAVPFTSVLSFDYSSYISSDYLHVIYGMSKDFAGGGLRLGCLYVQNNELKRAMTAINQFHWSGGPNEVIAATVRIPSSCLAGISGADEAYDVWRQMLEDEVWLDSFFALARARLSARNILTRGILDDAGIEYHRGANAGFFLWMDLSDYLPAVNDSDDPWDREQALMQKLLDNKVFMTNGQMLGAAKPGWFRIIFSQDEVVIKTGLKRMLEALGKE